MNGNPPSENVLKNLFLEFIKKSQNNYNGVAITHDGVYITLKKNFN